MPRVHSHTSSQFVRYSPLGHARGTSAPQNDDTLTVLNVDYGNGNIYCDECDKEFSRPSELKRHREQTLIHNPNAKRFQCQFCGSVHTQKANLKTHERIHLNEHKERCGLPLVLGSSEECNFLCSDPSSMARHINKIHIQSPFIDKGSPVPDWLLKAMREREVTKQLSQRTATASPQNPSPSLSTPSLSSSRSMPSTPSPFNGTSQRRTPTMSKSAVLDELDMIAVSKLNIRNNYVPPQPTTPGLAEHENLRYDYSLDQEYPATDLPSQGVQHMFSSTLFSQPSVREAAACSDPPRANLDFNLTGYDEHGLPLVPPTFEDISPCLKFSRGSEANVFSGKIPSGTTFLHANPTFTGNRGPPYHPLSPLNSSLVDQGVPLDLYNFS